MTKDVRSFFEDSVTRALLWIKFTKASYGVFIAPSHTPYQLLSHMKLAKTSLFTAPWRYNEGHWEDSAKFGPLLSYQFFVPGKSLCLSGPPQSPNLNKGDEDEARTYFLGTSSAVSEILSIPPVGWCHMYQRQNLVLEELHEEVGTPLKIDLGSSSMILE